MDYTKINTGRVASSQKASYDVGLRNYMMAIYKNMSAALGITGLVAFFAASSQQIMYLLLSTPLGMLVAFAPFIMVMILYAKLHSMSAKSVRTTFFAYSVLMGLSLSYIFIAYTGESIARAFFITAITFGSMSIYGYSTKKDLSSMASFFMMGLIGIIVASLVNIFFQSTAVTFLISAASVLVFVFFTAFHVQMLKTIYYQAAGEGEALEKIALMGALSLYMDFINLFVAILRLLGARRD